MENVQAIKQRFELIGNDSKFNRALEKAMQVAPTDISVLVTGESGVGKESIPKIIHSLSHRKHAKYIAVNCGAIPEGTIDSELFGHEKGAFTGATQTRSGYFEVADGGTIFLDEVGELPLTTQVRLLRVLENGEFLKVGSSQVQKTDVRIVAATNINMFEAIKKGEVSRRFILSFEYGRNQYSSVDGKDRETSIYCFENSPQTFGQKYKMPTVRLSEEAIQLLLKHRWPGNIRQLRNIAEQISVLEENREISASTLHSYLPNMTATNLPAVVNSKEKESDFSTEREILYKVLFDMKSDLNDLKKLTLELLKGDTSEKVQEENETLIRKIYGDKEEGVPSEETVAEVLSLPEPMVENVAVPRQQPVEDRYHFAEEIEEEETLSLQEKEIELIKKSLERNRGKRKAAAAELGISERTLYRKIKQYDL